MSATLRRPLALLSVLAALTAAGCGGTDTSDANESAQPTSDQTTQAADVAKVRENLDALVAAAGTDQLLQFYAGPPGTMIVVESDPGADESALVRYRLDTGTTEVAAPEDYPMTGSFANTPLTAGDIDLDALLSHNYGCDAPGLNVATVGWQAATVTASCEDSEDPASYWLSDLAPIELEVTDADSVTDAMTRLAAGSSGEVTSFMIVLNGTATLSDGTEIPYSNVQIGLKDGTRVRDLEVNDKGWTRGTGRVDAADYLSVPMAELDVDGLLECAAQLKEQVGEDSGSVYVNVHEDSVTWEFRDKEGTVYMTDTNCQPL